MVMKGYSLILKRKISISMQTFIYWPAGFIIPIFKNYFNSYILPEKKNLHFTLFQTCNLLSQTNIFTNSE